MFGRSNVQKVKAALPAALIYKPNRMKSLRGWDLNPRPLGYAYHYGFRCLKQSVCGLDFPFTLVTA